MRLFVAVNLSDEVRAAVASAMDAFPLRPVPWRWIEPGNLHITLKFLGEVEENAIGGIWRCVRRACAGTGSFTLELSRFGGFPDLRKPRVLFYAASTGAGKLGALAERVETELHDALGVERERRPFRPHVTLARIKKPLPADVLGALSAVPPLEGAVQRVRAVHLMQSKLTRQGAVYSPLKEIALDPGG